MKKRVRIRGKNDIIRSWLYLGLNPEDVDTAWDRYSTSTCCEWCYQDYKSQRDKQMDHCHDEGHFRNILCQTCNGWRRDITNIHKSWNKRDNKYVYNCQIHRCGQNILQISRLSLSEANKEVLQFKKDNWWYFPFKDFWT